MYGLIIKFSKSWNSQSVYRRKLWKITVNETGFICLLRGIQIRSVDLQKTLVITSPTKRAAEKVHPRTVRGNPSAILRHKVQCRLCSTQDLKTYRITIWIWWYILSQISFRYTNKANSFENNSPFLGVLICCTGSLQKFSLAVWQFKPSIFSVQIIKINAETIYLRKYSAVKFVWYIFGQWGGWLGARMGGEEECM
jgi:hypothetical protein